MVQEETHSLMDGKVHVYRRDGSRYWQCSTYMSGRNHRKSTKHESLAMAMDYAREWYMTVYVDSRRFQESGLTQNLLHKAAPQHRREEPAHYHNALHSPYASQSPRPYAPRPKKQEASGPTFAEAAEKFIAEYNIITQGERNEAWAQGHAMRINVHLIPFFGDMPVKQINAGLMQEYRVARSTNGYKGRIWEDLHDYVLFMANTGLRPDEAGRLEYRDVTIVTDQDSGERLLEIEVRGKRGVGYCKSMTGAILPFQRMQKRHSGKPTEKIFGKSPRDCMNKILDELNLKYDRDGNVRTSYSLRHTYICLRLMEGADIYQIAKNCRTSVEMIEQFYAAHLKNTLDASAINVRKPKRKPQKAQKGEDSPS